MLKRSYAAFLLVAALSVGVAFAQNTENQKDKNKDKNKDKTEAPHAVAAALPLALRLGEGSYLGVYLEEVTPERVKELGLAEERGAIIMKVIAGSPAEKAGFKENDVIVGFNGRRIESVRELQRLLSEIPAGRNVSLDVMRGGSQQTITATLTKRSQDFAPFKYEFNFDKNMLERQQEAMKRAEKELKRNEKAWKGAEKDWKAKEEEFKKAQKDLERMAPEFGNFNFVGPGEFTFFRGERLGVGIESLTDQLGEFFGIKDGKGVLVTEVREGTPAAKAGLKAGDVITAVDNEKIDGVGGLVKAISKKPEGTLTLTVVRNRSEQNINVTLEKSESLFTPRPRARAARYFQSV